MFHVKKKHPHPEELEKLALYPPQKYSLNTPSESFISPFILHHLFCDLIGLLNWKLSDGYYPVLPGDAAHPTYH